MNIGRQFPQRNIRQIAVHFGAHASTGSSPSSLPGSFRSGKSEGLFRAATKATGLAASDMFSATTAEDLALLFSFFCAGRSRQNSHRRDKKQKCKNGKSYTRRLLHRKRLLDFF